MASLTAISSLIFFYLSLLSFSSAANITVGKSLFAINDDSSWLSPSEEFAFGFRQLKNSDLFLVAIWFNKIPDRTIVWYANGDNPVPGGSKLELTANGLVLNNPGGRLVWSAAPNPATKGVSEAAMLDTGNFVLTAGNGSNFVWESFKNPTDTILPTQTLELGSMLFSRLTETNFSKGRFGLHFDNGSLKLHPVAWPSRSLYKSYYSSDTSSVNSSESGNKLVFDETGDIYIVRANGENAQLPISSSWIIPSLRTDLYYYRGTVDFDGVFSQYSYPKNSPTNQNWSTLRAIPQNICDDITNDLGSGACGFNSYCIIQENGRPSCHCPPEYVWVDPNNRFMGCRPNFLLGCEGDDESRDPGELYEIWELDQVNWIFGDYDRLEPYNQSECEQSCLYDCSCAVAMYGYSRCWKKRLPLSNGRAVTAIAKGLYKVRKAGSSSSKQERSIMASVFLLSGSVSFNVILLVVIALVVFVCNKKITRNNVQDSKAYDTNLRCFTYKELEEATDEFKEELGRGSFGIVYKGVLKSGNVVAVKKLDKLALERDKEFKTELNAIGRTHHKNLVQLLGFCDEGANRLLLYEFMGNGTLANLVFANPKPDWNLRVKICLEITKGLVYLHEECCVPIIHCDIKPQNILLDQYFTAKISDFGLSKLLLSNQSRTRTMIRGTRGYVAPEWFKNVPVTAKVDVYSFGVMLLEIICCRRSVEMECEEENRAILTDWAYDCYVEGRLDVLVDNDETAMADKDRLHKWLMIAIWCIQEDPSKRPSMKTVMRMLDCFLEVPNAPLPSSFSTSMEY